MIVEIYILIAAWVAFWLCWRRKLTLRSYPFFWVYFWSTFIHSVVGLPLLEDSGWISSRYTLALWLVLGSFLLLAALFVILEQHGTAAVRWRRQLAPDPQVVFKTAVLAGMSAALILLWTVLHGPPLLFHAGVILGALDQYQIREMRTEMVFGGAKYHWFDPGFTMLPIVMSVAVYAHSLQKPSLGRRVFASVIVVYSAVAVLAFLFKSQITVLCIALVFTRYLLRGVSATLLLATAVPVLVLLLMFAVYDLEDAGSAAWIDDVVDRIVVAYSRSAAAAFRLWPEHQPFFQGTTLPNPGRILPYENVPLPKVLFVFTYTDSEGHAPAPGFAEGYVNFGWEGFLFLTLLIGGCIVGLQLLFARLTLTPLSLGVMLYLLYETLSLGQNSLFYTLLAPEKVLVLTFLLVVFGGGWHRFSRTRRGEGRPQNGRGAADRRALLRSLPSTGVARS